MGSRSRRRAEKLRRRRERPPRQFAPPGAREMIEAAVEASRLPDPRLFHQLVDALAEGGARVPAELESAVAEAVRGARSRNWDGREVVRQVERRLGARHGRYVSEAAGGGGPRLGPWAAGEGIAMVDALAVAIQVVALLLSLPRQPRFGPSPRRTARSLGDARMLEKVRALLAKAESTTFPEEAEALSAKAQELMARHSLDEAMVGAAEGADDTPNGLRVAVDDPYAGAKSVLLAEVASANRCRAVWAKHFGISTVFGFDSDLEFVELLYTSLLVQATTAMVAAGTQVDRYGRSRTRSFRQSFLLSYAMRVGERLRAAEAASQAAAAEEYGEALLPVLADRSAAVDAARDAAFPDARTRSVSITNAAGWAAGSAAADLASLSGRTEVPAPSNR
ncbi:MAG: DUF2786 domain-containing protein [Acidimicrobiales bacterium]